jgi:PKD repeat protein
VGNCPFKVTFNASASTDPGNQLSGQSLHSKSISSYQWDFGDGETKNGKTVNHTYRSGGKFTAKLTVTDDKGATASATKIINIRSLSGGWKGYLYMGWVDIQLKLYFIQDDRDLTGETQWKYMGQGLYSDDITGRYKTDGTIDMMWKDKSGYYASVIVKGEPNATFNRIDGNFYQSGFTGQRFTIQKVSDKEQIPAVSNELVINNLQTLGSRNRFDLLLHLKK